MEKTEPKLGLEAVDSEGGRKGKVLYVPGDIQKEESLYVR